MTHANGDHWNYGYDLLGQVISGKKRNLDDLLIPGLQYEFDYDDIGNRTQTRTGGDASGSNLRTNNYTANALNQYSSRDIGPYIEVHGLAASNTTVTVNNQATDRVGHYFRKELNSDNSSAVVNQGITNVAVLKNAGPDDKDIVSTATGSRLLRQNPENFTYDDDGNLLTDGLWNYVWNGENRLIELNSRTNVPASQRKKLQFTYDHQGRRTSKVVSTWNHSTHSYLPTATNLFVYDNWNLIAALNSSPSQSPTLQQSYAWGQDLSRSGRRAGGVGGHLFLSQYSTPQSTTHFTGHDGNGNVILMVSASTGALSGQYEYSPFGEIVRETGEAAVGNPLRFSDKYWDEETCFYNFGLRYYDPAIDRWLSRDPIEELGGENVYGFVYSDPINSVDFHGLSGVWDDYLAPLFDQASLSLGGGWGLGGGLSVDVSAFSYPCSNGNTMRVAEIEVEGWLGVSFGAAFRLGPKRNPIINLSLLFKGPLAVEASAVFTIGQDCDCNFKGRLTLRCLPILSIFTREGLQAITCHSWACFFTCTSKRSLG